MISIHKARLASWCGIPKVVRSSANSQAFCALSRSLRLKGYWILRHVFYQYQHGLNWNFNWRIYQRFPDKKHFDVFLQLLCIWITCCLLVVLCAVDSPVPIWTGGFGFGLLLAQISHMTIQGFSQSLSTSRWRHCASSWSTGTGSGHIATLGEIAKGGWIMILADMGPETSTARSRYLCFCASCRPCRSWSAGHPETQLGHQKKNWNITSANNQLQLISDLSWGLAYVSPLLGLKKNTSGHQNLGKLTGHSHGLGSRLDLIRSTKALGWTTHGWHQEYT